MKLLSNGLGIIALLAGLYVFVRTWLFPSSIIKLYRSSKKRTEIVCPFIPARFIAPFYFNGNPKITIWWARVFSTLFLAMAIIIGISFLSQ